MHPEAAAVRTRVSAVLGAGALAAIAAAVLWFAPALRPASLQHRLAEAGIEGGPAGSARGQERRHATFGDAAASPDARLLADWVVQTGDNAGADFLIVDKKFATLFVFDAVAHLRGSSRVLLGAAVGDDSVPDIGARPIADVRPEERTTPAGRFIGERGHNTLGRDVVWVDYDDGVSIHRVVTNQPAERRLQRLASPDVADKRISYGCINVPTAFYEAYVQPIFATRHAPIYVLPEVKSVQQVFGARFLAAAEMTAAVK